MNPQITVGSQVFYIILSLIVLLIASIAEKTKQKEFAILLAIVLIFVSGFRGYTVGRDTRNYVVIFANINQGGYYAKEAGFLFLCKVILNIWNNYTFAFLLFSILIYGLIVFRLWELKDKISFSCATFSFYSFYFFESMNVMRQFCAVALVFWATRYLQKKKYIPFMVVVLCATIFFHSSALLSFLYLGMEFFSWKDLDRKQRRLLTTLFVGGILFSGVIISFLGGFTEKYQHFFRSAEANIGFRVFALLGIFMVSLFLYSKKGKENVYDSYSNYGQNDLYMIRNARIYYLVSCALTSIGYFYELMGRIGYYFIMYQFVYFGMIVREKNQIARWIMKLMVYLITLYVLYGYIFVHNGSWHHPYYFVWDYLK